LTRNEANLESEIKQDGSFYEVTPFDGEIKKTKIILTGKFDAYPPPILLMKIKGYGFFGDHSTWACAHSPLFHLNYLLKKYNNQSDKSSHLVKASALCGKLFFNDEITITSLIKLPFKVVDQLLHEA
jgi:hypothetical protein